MDGEISPLENIQMIVSAPGCHLVTGHSKSIRPTPQSSVKGVKKRRSDTSKSIGCLPHNRQRCDCFGKQAILRRPGRTDFTGRGEKQRHVSFDIYILYLLYKKFSALFLYLPKCCLLQTGLSS